MVSLQRRRFSRVHVRWLGTVMAERQLMAASCHEKSMFGVNGKGCLPNDGSKVVPSSDDVCVRFFPLI